MHPFALYLGATDGARTNGNASRPSGRPRYASVDASPLDAPAPVSLLGRLTTILRRRVLRAANG